MRWREITRNNRKKSVVESWMNNFSNASILLAIVGKAKVDGWRYLRGDRHRKSRWLNVFESEMDFNLIWYICVKF